MALTPGQLSIMEAARAVWTLIGEEHMGNFAVVGSAALLFHGYDVRTDDVDVAINAQSLSAFTKATKLNWRFRWTVGIWEYKSSQGFTIQIDFLEKDGSGGYLHQLRGYSLVDGIPVATLADLALGKGAAWVDRREEKDLAGFRFAVQEMVGRGVDFRGLGTNEREVLAGILERLELEVGGWDLAMLARTLL